MEACMYKEPVMCVYQIVNKRTGEKYVGSTNNFQHRRSQHWCTLKRCASNNKSPKLQSAYNEHGKEAFSFSILEIIKDKNYLVIREQFWMDILKPEYNILPAGKLPHDHVNNIDVKKKLSDSAKELWQDPIYREKHCKPRKWKDGTPNRKGVKLSDETKEKIRQANLGENNPNYGLHRSDETKMRQSLGHTKSNKYPGAISPDGTIYAPINNMSAFCREHDLGISEMVSVMHLRRRSHKGWTLYKGD